MKQLTTPTPPSSPQLSSDNLQELAAAKSAYRKIARAIRIAKFDGWTIAIFGALTFVVGLGDWSDMAIGMLLIVIAWIELGGASRLRALDPSAIRQLAINQLVLGGLLIIYSLWQIHGEMTGGGALAAVSASDAETGAALGEYSGMIHQAFIAIYGLLIVIAIGGMGGLAWFYFSRAKYLQRYLEQTPAWIISMQKSGVTL